MPLVVPEKKAIALKLRNPAKITTVIPDARVMNWKGVPITLVPHRLDETLILKNLGHDVPSPVQYYYHWSGQYQPFEVQRVTVDMLTLHTRAFVLNDMGAGKTISTLWALDYLRQKQRISRALIVAPLSTLERAWGDEVFRNFPHLNVAILHGSRAKRLKLLADLDYDLYVVNHDGMEIIAEDLAERPDIDLVIIDELAVLRNAQTNRWKAANEICNKQRPGNIVRRVWGLTGTPTPNAPTDAYAQVKLLAPDRIPFGFGRFKDQVMQQISQYVWVPRVNAQEVVAQYMHPSVRFALEDCVELPELVYIDRDAPMSADQAKAYNQMMNMLATEVANGEILAVNEGVKASKLIQIACLKHDTLVLTLSGWKPICRVSREDMVWDGEEWVSQDGAMFMGVKPVIECYGIEMTADHKVLTDRGWLAAGEVNGESSERPDRAAVRLPYGHRASRDDNGGHAMRDMVVPMRLREPGGAQEPVSSDKTPADSAQLRVPSWQRDPQNVENARVQHLVEAETTLPVAPRQGLAQIRRTWNQGLRAVGKFVRGVLPRHGSAPAGAYFGPGKQRRPVLPGELPVGNAVGAGEKPEAEVYDLINCGPRSRFVALGNDGPLIVHNCGVAYDVDGTERVAGAEGRVAVVKELVEESASGKAIVFCPFRSVVAYVTQQLRKTGHTVASIDGGTSKSERDRIFSQFQSGQDLQVIVAIPSCMAHGITLTAASTTIWYAPVTSNEIFTQANARCHRPGQKHKCVVAMIGGTPIERKYYKRLKEKQSAQGLLLELLRTST